MKKLIKIVVPALFLLISCQPEVIEKEVEVEKKSEGEGSASPKYGLISIKTSLPNDNGADIKLTNDSAPVNVKITGPDSIEKVMWKKGSKGIGVKPVSFFADSNSHQLLLDSNSSGTFTVTENGWYDIVAQDIAGRYEWEQVEVKTIDKTPPADITNFSAEYANGYINLTWNDPTENVELYNSPFNGIRISYVYNNNPNDSDNREILIPKGAGKYSIQRAAGKTIITYLDIKVQAIDEVGNASLGATNQVECFETISTTTANFIKTLTDLAYSAKVVVSGNYKDMDNDGYKIMAIRAKNIQIALDLSGVEVEPSPYYCPEFSNWKCLTDIVLPPKTEEFSASSFEECTNLQSVYIPSNVNFMNLGCFYGDINLKKILFEDTNKEYFFYFDKTGLNDWVLLKKMKLQDSSELPNMLANIGLNSEDLRRGNYVLCTEESRWKTTYGQ